MRDTPTVSIVMAAYNHEAYVKTAVESALAQDCDALEVVIVNDGSSDSTGAVCDALAAAHPKKIRLVHQENRGVSATLNRLLELARGDYVAFLASDDAFAANKVSRQLAYFKNHRRTGLVASHVTCIDAAGAVRPGVAAAFNAHYPKAEWVQRMMLGNLLCATTVMAPRRMLRDMGGFSLSLHYTQDYDVWLRVLLRQDIHVIPEPLTQYRWHGRNLSAADLRASAEETWQLLCKHAPALIARYPALAERAELFYETLVLLTLEAGNLPAAETFLRKKMSRDASCDADAVRLLDCLLRMQRTDAVRELLVALEPVKHRYAAPTQRAIASVAEHVDARG